MGLELARPAAIDLLVEGGAILADGTGTILWNGSLAIDCGRIVAAGPAKDLHGHYTAKRVLDARHKAVLPGLIDTHHHFLQNLLRGSRDDLSFTDWIAQVSSPLISLAVHDYLAGDPELQVQATRIGCAEALLSGITCIVNMEWATSPEVIGVYEEAGIRAIHVLTLTDVDEWGSPGMLLSVDQTLDLAEHLIDRCAHSAAGRVAFRYGPACENSVSPGLLSQVRRLADEHGVGIHMHIAESRYGWENIQQRYGQTPVQYLADLGVLGQDVLGAHCIWLADDDIRLLQETGTTVSYNPECHMKLALGTARVTEMLRAGVTVSLGTDTCAVNDNMDLFEAMRVGAFLQKHMTQDPAAVPAGEALRMATLDGAQAIGLGDQIGSLEVGKRADVILVDLSGVHMRPINHLANTLVYSASARDVDTVIVDGQVVVEHRKLCTLNAEAAMAQAEAYALRRFREAGLYLSPYYTLSRSCTFGTAPNSNQTLTKL
jgi:5-methylthioadenosine/S-adenosylhomocysteine deaminase